MGMNKVSKNTWRVYKESPIESICERLPDLNPPANVKINRMIKNENPEPKKNLYQMRLSMPNISL